MTDPTTARVRFHEGTSRTGPMTWGQRAIWEVVRWLPPDDDSLNQLGWAPVGSATVAQVCDMVRLLVERHESLRTTYAEHDGGLVQHVAASGEIEFLLSELEPGDLAEAVAPLGERIRAGAFDNAAGLPVRAAIGLRAGVPAAVAIAASHLAVDGWSFQIVMDELRAVLAAGPDGAAGLRERSRQPLDRAGFEASEAGARRERRTLDYWARQANTVPASMLATTSTPQQLDRDWAHIDSPALALAAHALAGRSRCNTATALLGSTALLLASYLGEPEAALRVIVSTRFKPEDEEFVGAFNQNAIVRLQLADESTERFLTRAARTALNAYRHSEACPVKMEEQLEEIARRRGITPGGYCFFNDIRFSAEERNAPPPELDPLKLPTQLEVALAHTRLTRPDSEGRQSGAKFFLFLDGLRESCALTLCTDPRFLPVSAGDFLRELEHLTVRAAQDPGAPVGELVDRLRRRPQGAHHD
ncbi:condensation domain-containing protein [Streptomyces sp. AC602_WCS936]|uniref:condensation domain-containing protein n=1 Tax=Streptomyces sp. AC602_WCS936 TaxID=2823685 RepID=UPI001C256469|nr:condensation domain-containing protein [Streptomyces sp. AC602_WCS936]